MKFYLSSFILESAVVRSEMEVVLRCEDYVQVDANAQAVCSPPRS